MYITIGNNLPYEPISLYEDDSVRIVEFTTPPNTSKYYIQLFIYIYHLDLIYNHKEIELIRKNNTELADAL